MHSQFMKVDIPLEGSTEYLVSLSFSYIILCTTPVPILSVCRCLFHVGTFVSILAGFLLM